MDFTALQAANNTIKTTDIGKGKEYAEVNQRIKAFRMCYPEGQILTNIVSWVDGVVVFRAEVFTDDGRLLGSGTAYEKEGSTFINKTSAVENCETSAVGRALAMCGFGIDTSIASYEEVANAKANQEEKQAPKTEQAKAVAGADLRAKVLKYCNAHYNADQIKAIAKRYDVQSINEMSAANCHEFINLLKKQGKDIND